MIAYREPERRDADAVARLHARSWRESYRGAFSDAFLDGDLVGERLAVWQARLTHASPNQLVLLAVDGPALAGFVCVYGAHDPQWGSFVDNLHVAAEWKGSGVGRALMQRAGAWLADRYPGEGVHLLVLETNTAARRFYERLGGRNAETFTNETHGGAVLRSCRYVWASAALLTSRTTGPP